MAEQDITELGITELGITECGETGGSQHSHFLHPTGGESAETSTVPGPLTGLANRREGSTYLQAQVELCHRLNLPLGLAFIDIDHFKSVNDIHGHLTGDLVIQQVAQILKSTLRASDMACRWGGDEFIVISPNTNLEQMARVAEKMRLAVLQSLADHVPPVTVSLGVTAATGKAINQTQLITDADAALYWAKQNGRNRVELAPANKQN